MTREKALKDVRDSDCGYNGASDSEDIVLLIEDIYDDFESRTCENCKHEKVVAMVGTCCDNQYSIGYNNKTDVGDGCNKFERKDT